MICVACQTDNKDTAKICRKCGIDLQTPPLWKPTWAWHGKLLAGIYLALVVAYFAISAFLSRLPEPYRIREVPKEVTPWIKKG